MDMQINSFVKQHILGVEIQLEMSYLEIILDGCVPNGVLDMLLGGSATNMSAAHH